MSYACRDCKGKTRVNRTRGSLRERICITCKAKFVTQEVRKSARTFEKYDALNKAIRDDESIAAKLIKSETNREYYLNNCESIKEYKSKKYNDDKSKEDAKKLKSIKNCEKSTKERKSAIIAGSASRLDVLKSQAV